MSKGPVETIVGHQLSNAAAMAAVAVAAPTLGAAGVLPEPFSIALLGIVPGLAQAAIAARHQERIELTISRMRQDAAELGTKVENITEAQYVLANECVLAVGATIDQAKLDYLRRAFRNSLSEEELSRDSPELLARLIRSVSAQELDLIGRLFHFDSIRIADEDFTDQYGYIVRRGTNEAMQVGALIQLGLLHSLSTSWDFTSYAWSPVTAKLLALVRTADWPQQSTERRAPV